MSTAWNTGRLPHLVESKEKRVKKKFAGSTRGTANNKKHLEKIISYTLTRCKFTRIVQN